MFIFKYNKGKKMRNIKSLVAVIAGLFAFTSVQAGEMTVTGSMQATYQTEVDDVTGNPLGMNTDLTFTGETEVLSGTAVKWTMGTDGTFLGEGSADHKIVFTNDYGSIKIGNSGDSANNVDDITPTAFEEANGSGSGTYTNDVGSGLEGSMSLGYSNADLFGTGVSVDATYYPKLDGTTNNEKAATGTTNNASKSAQSFNVGLPFASIPVIGSTPLGGAKITLGYAQADATNSEFQTKEDGTVAIVLPVGPLSVGFQKKAYQTVSTANTTKNFYKDDIIGVAYAINDELAISYNIIQSNNHTNDGKNDEQETKAINIAYTVGGLTIAANDARTSNDNYVADSDDDTRTLSLKTAF
tara:strand:- start:80 stop:1144 length:1065 start_codon:yes stop_codon:yes gene_type:complete